MKKVLVGCLVVVVLGIVALVGAGFFVYRATAPMVQNAREYLAGLSELGKLSDLERDVKNQAPYTAPSSGELTEAQVQRFARVQDGVRKEMGQRFDQINAKYKHLENSNPDQAVATFTEAMAALKEVATVLVDARRLQVNAMNQEGFSQSEYEWVRDRVFQAAGVEAVSKIPLDKITEALKNQTNIEDLEAPEVPKPDVPEKNRELVKPYLNRVNEWVPLAFFGL